MSFKHCPGIKNLISPTRIIIRTCPKCGEEIEFFDDESEVKCPSCGHTLHREVTQSCVTWCKYAEKCIEDLVARHLITPARAEELKRLIKKKS